MAEGWTFLTNHAHVLLCIAAEPDITLREAAQRVGITERAAQRILADLIEAGYLRAEKVGRRNRYHVNAKLPLRHPLESKNPISVLLALTADRKGAGAKPKAAGSARRPPG